MRLYLLYVLCTLLTTLAMPAGAVDRIVLIVGGIEKQIYLPARLAEQLGYFKQQGLEVELMSEPSGVEAEDVLLAGAAQGVVGAYDHTIVLQAKGKAVQSVVQFSIAPGEVELVATPQALTIKSPADFRGRRLGVTGLGSSTSFLTQYLAIRHEVKVTAMTLVPVGAGASFIAAMKRGQIDAGMTSEPTASRLLVAGDAKLLIDLRTPEATRKALGGLYPFACLYMQTAWINTHKVETQKLANAFVKALRYINTHSAAEIADVVPINDHAGNKPLYIQSLANSKSMFTPDGQMPPSGPPSVLNILSIGHKDVRGKTIDLPRTYTTVFVTAAE
jgi:NitT/TauT family transport system substrate-binding protein